MIDAAMIESFLVGVVLTGIAAVKFVRDRISISEANEIYNRTMAAINDYKASLDKGELTADDKLRVAEETLEAIGMFVKALKS